jgi:hypothetical protein
MSMSNIVASPSLEAFARALGFRPVPGASATGDFKAISIEPLRNRIEDAEVEIELEARHSVQDQRQAADEEMNRPSK